MYAIVEVGGNQYRVEKDASILVDRLAAGEGDGLRLKPLFYRGDKETIADAASLERVQVSARVVGHERGKKLRVLNFKPKGGRRRAVGHRSDLTRLRVTEIKLTSKSKSSQRSTRKTEGKSNGS